MLLSPALLLAQGSLTPPGPPAPTMKTLDQLDGKLDTTNSKVDAANSKLSQVDAKTEKRIPLDAAHTPADANNHFVIGAAGSYYLTDNLSAAETNGIHITVPGVTLDLNGFRVARLSGSGGSGILIESAASDCSVYNGTISGWNNGVNASTAPALSLRDLTVTACSTAGIFAGGIGAQIDRCFTHDNANNGINVGSSARVSNCEATSNGGVGIQVLLNCVIINCVASGNRGSAGIATNSGCTIVHCSAGSNNSSLATSAGIAAGAGCEVIDCAALNNTSTATLSSSTGMGISAAVGSLVRNCAAYGNYGDGIRASSECHIIANQCGLSGSGAADGAAIHITSGRNRIEGNNATTSKRGIDVSAAGNLIIKNSASGNVTNYAIVAGNSAVVVAAPASVPIAGNAGGSGVGSTDPWANISY